MRTIFLLLTLYAIYRIYTESGIYIQYATIWINQNYTMTLFIFGVIGLYLFTYQQELVYQGTSLLYDLVISKHAKIGNHNIQSVSNMIANTGGTKRVKRSVSGLMKKKVGAKQMWRCNRCSTTLDETYEVNHIIPLEEGGTNQESNLEALCRTCHGKISIDAIIRKNQ
jgi:5-methylcytosine-specific restriction protein A